MHLITTVCMPQGTSAIEKHIIDHDINALHHTVEAHVSLYQPLLDQLHNRSC